MPRDTRPEWAKICRNFDGSISHRGFSYETILRIENLCKTFNVPLNSGSLVQIKTYTAHVNKVSWRDGYKTEVYVDGKNIGSYTY